MTRTARTQNRRFMIIGLPRSGTTYLMTLLNTHPDIHCAGELFNPYAIIDAAARDEDPTALLERDKMPLRFLEAFYSRPDTHLRMGCKFMLGHAPRILDQLPQMTDLSLIYLRRDNRLAQAASYLKALQSQNWAQTREDDYVTRKIQAGPHSLLQHAQEFATTDRLFGALFSTLPQHKIALEYRDMFAPDFAARICAFLGLPPAPDMHSPLVKQGANRILDRFRNPKPIRDYFTALGRADWLEYEI